MIQFALDAIIAGLDIPFCDFLELAALLLVQCNIRLGGKFDESMDRKRMGVGFFYHQPFQELFDGQVAKEQCVIVPFGTEEHLGRIECVLGGRLPMGDEILCGHTILPLYHGLTSNWGLVQLFGMKTPRDRADSMIVTNRYMTLATATKGGDPWISPLFFAYQGGRFYWYSPKGARHSRLIAQNPRVAITIFDSRADPKDQERLIRERIDFTSHAPLRVYVAQVKQMWVLGPPRMYKGKYLDSREEVLIG